MVKKINDATGDAQKKMYAKMVAASACFITLILTGQSCVLQTACHNSPLHGGQESGVLT